MGTGGSYSMDQAAGA